MSTSRDATHEDAGRVCPFCRFRLKSGAEVMPCRSCSALHHTECWEENRGCAVMGCQSAPRATTGACPAAPPAAAPVAPAPPAPTPPAPPSPPRTSAFLAVALVLLAVAIGGGAVAL